MRKKIFYLFLTIVSMAALIGCGGSNSSEEVSESASATQGNVLESAFLSDDHFELREESITLEYGTPLSDDVSEYVIAKDYEGITCKYEEIGYFDYLDGQSGYAIFRNIYGDVLTMTIYYTDTTPPTIERTEYTYYTLFKVWGSDELILGEQMGPGYTIDDETGNRIFGYQILNFEEYFGISDNAIWYPSAIIIDGISHELEDYAAKFTIIPAMDYGDHTIILTAYDTAGLTSTFELTLHIVADISPEEREILISEYGYTEEQINAAVEEYVSQMEN